MKKTVIFLVIIALLFSLSSCRNAVEKQAEKLVEKVEEQAEKAEDALKDKEEDISERFNAVYSYSEDEIPEGFPTDAIPLYEGGDSKIVGGGAVSAGNDVIYSVSIVTKSDPKDVADDVEDQLKKIYKKDEMNKIAMGDFAMFVVGSDDWNFTVTLGSADDEGYKDYETIINYTTVSD